jgi:hypothetical protein
MLGRPQAARDSPSTGKNAGHHPAAALLLAVLLACCVPATSGVDQAPTPWAAFTPRPAVDKVRRASPHALTRALGTQNLVPAQRLSRARADNTTIRGRSRPPRACCSLTFLRRSRTHFR